MKNPLLVPELREMLRTDQKEDIRDFCESTPPSVLADFLGALQSEEVLEVMRCLSSDALAATFIYFDDDVKVFLLEFLAPEEIIMILLRMSGEEVKEFFSHLPETWQKRVKDIVRESQREDALQVLSLLEGAPEEIAVTEALDLSRVEIFMTRNGKLERSKRIEKDCWVNIVNPSRKELEYLSEHFAIPHDFLAASLDMDEIARTEVENDVTLLIVKAPFFDESSTDILYFTLPIGIILANGFIITISSKPVGVIADFINGKVRNFSTSNRPRFILQLFFRSTLLYLQYLKQINNAATIIQKKLEQSSQNKQLIKLLNIEKSLVYFTTSLKSNAFVLERLQKMPLMEIDGANRSLFDDITIESKQAIEMSNIYSDILSGMMDAFASVISNNLNIVMKLLTSITIILTIPILLASLYGMNVHLPFQEAPHAFLIVIGFSVLVSLIGIIFFIKRRWLEM